MAKTLSGSDMLIEIGMSHVEGIVPSISTADYNTLHEAMEDFVLNKRSLDDSKEVFRQVIGRDDPLVRVFEIINLTEEPIPCSDDIKVSEDSHNNRKKTRTWGGYEDQRLVGGIYRFGLDNWPMVAAFVGNGRTRAQCAQRWARGLNPKICKKHWSSEEDEQLKQLVQTYGDKAWTKIAAAFGNRSDVQCRYHYRQLVKGDEAALQFMPLNRGTPVALSSQVFYNHQFQSPYVVPTQFGMPTLPPSIPVIPGVPMNIPMQTDNTHVYPSPYFTQNHSLSRIPVSASSIQLVAKKQQAENKPKTEIPPHIPTPPPVPPTTQPNPALDNFLSHFS